jgi:hypothetical protein
VEAADESVADRERSFWRRHVVGIVALAGLVLTGAWAVSSWALTARAPDYTGRTVAAHFDFQCTNDIFWVDPASGYRWWAGDPAPIPAKFDTSAPTSGDLAGLPYHHAQGTLHFDSSKTATFRSDAGGRLPMTREPRNVFHTMECSIDPSEASPPK